MCIQDVASGPLIIIFSNLTMNELMICNKINKKFRKCIMQIPCWKSFSSFEINEKKILWKSIKNEKCSSFEVIDMGSEKTVPALKVNSKIQLTKQVGKFIKNLRLGNEIEFNCFFPYHDSQYLRNFTVSTQEYVKYGEKDKKIPLTHRLFCVFTEKLKNSFDSGIKKYINSWDKLDWYGGFNFDVISFKEYYSQSKNYCCGMKINFCVPFELKGNEICSRLEGAEVRRNFNCYSNFIVHFADLRVKKLQAKIKELETKKLNKPAECVLL